MFQYTTTNIINSSLDSNGVLAKYSGDASAFTVTRVGRFLATNIVGDVQKRAYQAGVYEVAQVTVPVVTAGKIVRLDIDVRLSQKTLPDYGNANTERFVKPVVVEALATGVAATDAATLAAEISDLKNRFGVEDVQATTSGADIIITATDFHQRIYSVKVLEEVYTPTSIITPEFSDVTAGTFAVTTAGRVGYGNDQWMKARVVMDTLERSRPFGISKDELPITGGNYTGYILRYSIEKDHVDGMNLANNTSVTTHVFYVREDLVAAFEDQLDNTVTVTLVVGGGVIQISASGATTLNAGGAGVTLTANGASGTVTWTSSDETIATVDAAGVVTPDAVNTGTTTITATDSEGTTSTVVITVQ